jgi:hypothetical protein
MAVSGPSDLLKNSLIERLLLGKTDSRLILYSDATSGIMSVIPFVKFR